MLTDTEKQDSPTLYSPKSDEGTFDAVKYGFGTVSSADMYWLMGRPMDGRTPDPPGQGTGSVFDDQ
jgi:hypothetical protein